jgi:LPXTG-motif cell wall-anchored protein
MLVTDGAQRFGGVLDASTQAAVEANVMRATSGTSNLIVLGVGVVLALAGWAVVRWRRRQHATDAAR